MHFQTRGKRFAFQAPAMALVLMAAPLGGAALPTGTTLTLD